MNVEKLTSDFYHIDNSPRYVFPETFVEAPVLLKRYEYYYALYRWCCCYCLQGSRILVYRVTSPLGPYTQQPGGDIAYETINQTNIDSLFNGRIQALPTLQQGCQYHNQNTTSVARSAQQNYVIRITNAEGFTTFLWTEDRWQQAPDRLKGHEPQYWMPLHFDFNGTISKINWIDQFTIDV